jgi:DNA-binding HxlR family transcriptional regulator
METEETTYRCGVEVTLEIIGGKWKGVILWHLTRKTLRFSQLRRRLPGVTQKMLTQQLRELERDGLLDRRVFAEVPPRVEYSLTEKGRTLTPLLSLMCEWGKQHLDEPAGETAAEQAAG